MADLTDAQRLTLLMTMIQSVLLTDDPNDGTLWDRLYEVGVPVHELFETARPYSSPPYTSAEFKAMLNVRSC